MDSDQPTNAKWPAVEGRYQVGNRSSPIAVCTMASVDIKLSGEKVAITGKCVTENLGIEKIVKNTVSNPNIRYIIVCGRESMGHFVDNALESLVENGVDPENRIIGAKGGIPVLKNLSNDEIDRFRKQVEIVNMAGITEQEKIMEKVNEYFDKPVKPTEGEAIVSSEPQKVIAETHPISEWSQDEKGYFTISLDRQRGDIVVSHHDASGKIQNVISGKTCEDLYHKIISGMGLVSRLDHAAYLGRELAKAEVCLRNGIEYEQDAPLLVPRKEARRENPSQNQAGSSDVRIDTDGKEIVPLPTHGKLISVKKIEQRKETILTYVVNDREFPISGAEREKEEQFRDFLKGHGMCRVF